MPIFSPPRFQEPYLPFQPDPFLLRMVGAVESFIKDGLFGCRMCGNCILQETAFICPMTCAKGLRNGPCGEAGDTRCVVDASRPCTWYMIFERAERMGWMDRLLEVNAPIDGGRAGHEAWADLLRQWKANGMRPSLLEFITNRSKFDKEYARFLYDLRQPSWWGGDSAYHPPAYHEPVSTLEAALRSGAFVTTLDLEPPSMDAPEVILEKAKLLKGHVTAANFSDGAFATSRMSSLASCLVCMKAGLEPVLQIQSRDRNRLAIASDALGASALGVHNILCLSGDYQNLGPAPVPAPVQFDLDAIQMLWMLRRMRDEGKFLDGREMPQSPKYFLGAAGSPFAAPHRYDAIRVEKKVNAGAQFIQTQIIFDPERFMAWMEALDKRSLHDKVYILAAVMPLPSAEVARAFFGEPGMSMTESILKRMENAATKDISANSGNHFQQEEGLTIALELIEKIRMVSGVKGIHLVVEGNEELAPRIVSEAHLSLPAS